jgi:hypothetical protein
MFGSYGDSRGCTMSEPAPTTKPRDPIPTGKVTIELEAAGVGAPLICRVKRAIKYLGRTHGLRVTRIELPKEGEGGR